MIRDCRYLIILYHIFIEQMLLKYAKQRYQVNINDSAEYPYEAEYQYLIK